MLIEQLDFFDALPLEKDFLMVTPSKCNENPVLTPICKTNLIVRLWTVFVKLRTLHVPDFPSKEGDRECICHLPRYRVVMGVKYPSSPPMRIFSRAQERNSGNATPTGPRSFSPGRFGNKNASSTIDGSTRSSYRRLRKVIGLPPRLVPTKVGFLGLERWETAFLYRLARDTIPYCTMSKFAD